MNPDSIFRIQCSVYEFLIVIIISTLQVQKKTLADQLKLKTRQIEVWFQNRRARTKLKQTEIDYELLKKQCQNLSDENKRLKKELQELKVRQSPLCPQRLSKPVCSSCDQKLLKRNEDNNN